jgi:hypothetical protein
MDDKAKIYITHVIALGAIVLSAAIYNFSTVEPLSLTTHVALTVAASLMRVKLPGINGSYSLLFLPVLAGIAELKLAEVVIMAGAGATAQSTWRLRSRPTAAQVVFNVAAMLLSAVAAYGAFQLAVAGTGQRNLVAVLTFAAAVFFTANIVLVSGAICLVERQSFGKVWNQWMLWSLPYYLAGGVIAAILVTAGQEIRWASWLLVAPVMYLLYQFFRLRAAQSAAQQHSL